MRVPTVEAREHSFELAMSVHANRGERGDASLLVRDAGLICDYLTAPTIARLRVGLVRNQSNGDVVAHQPGGNTMQLHDNEKVDYTLEALDAKGYAVDGDSFTASSSDESVVTLKQDGSKFTAVAGAPGSATVTFTDGTLNVTEAIDVVAGDVAKIQVVAGDPVPQDAPSA